MLMLDVLSSYGDCVEGDNCDIGDNDSDYEYACVFWPNQVSDDHSRTRSQAEQDRRQGWLSWRNVDADAASDWLAGRHGCDGRESASSAGCP